MNVFCEFYRFFQRTQRTNEFSRNPNKQFRIMLPLLPGNFFNSQAHLACREYIAIFIHMCSTLMVAAIHAYL